jgi:chromosome segregation ATPase
MCSSMPLHATTAHTKELALADERARGLERALLQRHDSESLRFKERIQGLEAQVAMANTRRDAMEQRSNGDRQALDAAQGRIEQLSRQLAEQYTTRSAADLHDLAAPITAQLGRILAKLDCLQSQTEQRGTPEADSPTQGA